MRSKARKLFVVFNTESSLTAAYHDALRKSVCYLGLVLFSVSGALLADFSKSSDGRYPYNPVTVPLAVDCVKIFLSVIFLAIVDDFSGSTGGLSSRDYFFFAVPAACYFVSNTCAFFIIARIGVVQYQIMGNMKIIFSAFAMRIFLGRVLRQRQWLALGLLFVGLLSAQLPVDTRLEPHFDMYGYSLVLISCTASSIGGVFNEKLLKSRLGGDSIHWKNIQLYSWGVVFGLIAVQQTAKRDSVSVFFGYNVVVLLMIIFMALSGLIVSVILKYSDSLSKSFVTSLSIVISSCVQALRNVDELSPRLLISVIIIYYALRLYDKKE